MFRNNCSHANTNASSIYEVIFSIFKHLKMHIRPNSACKIVANQFVRVKRSLAINFKEIQEDSSIYGMI